MQWPLRVPEPLTTRKTYMGDTERPVTTMSQKGVTLHPYNTSNFANSVASPSNTRQFKVKLAEATFSVLKTQSKLTNKSGEKLVSNTGVNFSETRCKMSRHHRPHRCPKRRMSRGRLS